MKKIHARQITLKNKHAKDIFEKDLFTKTILAARKSSPPPPSDNFSNGLSLNRVGLLKNTR